MSTIRDMLVKLGWSHYEGDYWTKGQLPKMKFDDAVIWELEYWKKIQGNMFECPDCGYHVTSQEFFDNG